MPNPLKKLEARHKAACRMRIEGKDNAYIAAALGMSKRTLEYWWCDDLIIDYLQTLATNVENEFAVQLATAGMTAVQELTRMLTLDDPADEAISYSQKLAVARELMDRTPALARVTDRPQDPSGGRDGDTTNILQIIANMSNDDLADFVHGGWQKSLASNGDGNSAA